MWADTVQDPNIISFAPLCLSLAPERGGAESRGGTSMLGVTGTSSPRAQSRGGCESHSTHSSFVVPNTSKLGSARGVQGSRREHDREAPDCAGGFTPGMSIVTPAAASSCFSQTQPASSTVTRSRRWLGSWTEASPHSCTTKPVICY